MHLNKTIIMKIIFRQSQKQVFEGGGRERVRQIIYTHTAEVLAKRASSSLLHSVLL